MLEQLIEGNLVSIATPALDAWESHVSALLALGALAVVAVTLMFASRIRPDESMPALGVGMLLTLPFAAGLTWWLSRLPRPGLVMALFPALAERFGHVDLAWQFPLVLGFTLLAVALVDVPGWRALRVHLGRMAMAALIAVAGLGIRAASSATLDERGALERVSGLPCIRPDATQALELHVGRERTVSLEDIAHVTSLGMRARPSFLFFGGGRFIEPVPGSAEDLAGLADRSRYRAALSPEEIAAWGIGTTVLHAPAEEGPFEVPLSFSNGLIQVSSTLTAVAVAERGDPLFPLAANHSRVFARRVYRGAALTSTTPVRDLANLTLQVTSDSVVDGFHTFVVEIDDPARTPSHRRLEVVPRDGHYLVRGDEHELVRESTPGVLLAEEGAPCVVPFLPGVCACGPAGPTHCLSRSGHPVEGLLWASLSILTVGFWALEHGPPEDSHVESRLIELDGVPVPVPEVEPAPRRRSRRRR